MERHEFLTILEEQIRTKRARPMIRREMDHHIEDQKKAFLAEGMTGLEAEAAAVRQMGDPVETGIALDRIHRPRMEWRVLAAVLFISTLGMVLQHVVTLTAYPSGISGLNEILDSGLGKRLAFMLAGILLMLVVCWIDYTFLNKYAVPLWIFINMLLILCILKSPMINGRPYYLVHVSCLLIPFFAGILYHFRGQGFKGLIKSAGCLCISLLVIFFYYRSFIIFVTGLAGMALIHAAIYKKWFGERRILLCGKLWGILFLAAAVFLSIIFLKTGGWRLADYQAARIDAWLHPGKYEEMNYFVLEVKKVGKLVREEDIHLTINMLQEIKNSYLWLFLFKYLGAGKGIVLTAAVLSFWIFLFRIVSRQKNQFGHMVGLGCVLFLSLETMAYVGMNFSALPPGMAYMPFISEGGAFLLISYFYMGVLLSVCNNSRVVANDI